MLGGSCPFPFFVDQFLHWPVSPPHFCPSSLCVRACVCAQKTCVHAKTLRAWVITPTINIYTAYFLRGTVDVGCVHPSLHKNMIWIYFQWIFSTKFYSLFGSPTQALYFLYTSHYHHVSYHVSTMSHLRPYWDRLALVDYTFGMPVNECVVYPSFETH